MKLLSSSLIHICNSLSDLNFRDGNQLGTGIGISRNAVFKHIKNLKNHQVEVESIKNQGYRLKLPLLLLDKDFICSKFNSPKYNIEIFESLDSTNNYLKNKISSKEKIDICLAEKQTGGRGRLGREWHSPFGQNIYLSYALTFNKDISELSGLSIVTGIAALNAIREIGINEKLMLKWPNDGIFNGSKFMGNLVELQSEANSFTRAIIGVGINVNMLKADNIDQDWTSLHNITNKYINRNQLVIALIENLNFSLEQFNKYGISYFLNQWHDYDALFNRKISLNIDNVAGIAKGINEHGNLLVECSDGITKSFSAGETSIKK